MGPFNITNDCALKHRVLINSLLKLSYMENSYPGAQICTKHKKRPNELKISSGLKVASLHCRRKNLWYANHLGRILARFESHRFLDFFSTFDKSHGMRSRFNVQLGDVGFPDFLSVHVHISHRRNGCDEYRSRLPLRLTRRPGRFGRRRRCRCRHRTFLTARGGRTLTCCRFRLCRLRMRTILPGRTGC